MKALLISLLLMASVAHAQTSAVLNPAVRQDTIKQTICVSGYTATIRPPVSYTNGIKKKLMAAQGIDWSRAKEFELDHHEPLALGGHPRNLANLMLQKWDGTDGAKVKDKLEVTLKNKVCRGDITLRKAQACIWTDWQACAKQIKR